VGKTTTTINVAACLAALGKKVLLLDLIPRQRHQRFGRGKNRRSQRLPAPVGGRVPHGKNPPHAFKHLEIIPSEVEMCGAEIEIARAETICSGYPVFLNRCCKPAF